jgi:hypothetical protein
MRTGEPGHVERVRRTRQRLTRMRAPAQSTRARGDGLHESADWLLIEELVAVAVAAHAPRRTPLRCRHTKCGFLGVSGWLGNHASSQVRRERGGRERFSALVPVPHRPVATREPRKTCASGGGPWAAREFAA